MVLLVQLVLVSLLLVSLVHPQVFCQNYEPHPLLFAYPHKAFPQGKDRHQL